MHFTYFFCRLFLYNLPLSHRTVKALWMRLLPCSGKVDEVEEFISITRVLLDCQSDWIWTELGRNTQVLQYIGYRFCVVFWKPDFKISIKNPFFLFNLTIKVLMVPQSRLWQGYCMQFPIHHQIGSCSLSLCVLCSLYQSTSKQQYIWNENCKCFKLLWSSTATWRLGDI